MSSVIDYTDGYLSWDQTEAITLTLRHASGSVNRSIATAKRTNARRNESVFQGVSLHGDESFWLVPAALLTAGDKVREGDTITDSSSVIHTINAVQQVRKGVSLSHYRCLVMERL
jgi:hypothetical protein